MRNRGGVFSVFRESPARPLTVPRPYRAHAAWMSSDALDPGFHYVRTHWIRGFIAFQLARNTRTVMLMVPV